MILGIVAGCGLSSSPEPSADATPLPAAQPTTPTARTTPTTTTSPHHDRGAQNWHCSDKAWWRDYGARHGLDPSAYVTRCGHQPPASWLEVHPGASTPNGSSGSTSSSSRHPATDPYGCQADIDAGLSMAQNRCGNVHLNSTETDVESPSQMQNPASRWELCHMLASPGTAVYQKYCQ
ncbi:hypothetical protein Acsp06_62890 [Actinomycetospora sp. NBRC 106375]|nr:hypothetical protein Acsp06_62890 [Actinomycetospora sp. NBRC 106375]